MIDAFVIVIDEFQLMRYLKDSAFFCLIQSSTQKQFNVSYIFAGSLSKTAKIIDTINGPNGTFGGSLISYNIEPFTKEETRRYVNKKAFKIQFSDDGFEIFYSSTAGIPLYIDYFVNVLPNNVICDGEFIRDKLYFNADQIAAPSLLLWIGLTQGEKEFIIYLIENDGGFLEDFYKNFDYVKVSILRFIDSLLHKGIIEYTSSGYVVCDIMLKNWLIIYHKNNGYWPV